MNELYQAIEEKIRAAGYTGKIDGRELYDDICDRIEDKENGEYLLMSKRDDEVWFEYQLQIHDEDFNLSVLTIHTPKGDFTVNFDD